VAQLLLAGLNSKVTPCMVKLPTLQAMQGRIHTQNTDPQVRQDKLGTTRQALTEWRHKQDHAKEQYMKMDPTLVCGGMCCAAGTLWPACPAHKPENLEKYLSTNKGKSTLGTLFYTLKMLEVKKQIVVHFDEKNGLLGINQFKLSDTGEESDLPVGFPSSVTDKERHDRSRLWRTAGFTEHSRFRGVMVFDLSVMNRERGTKCISKFALQPVQGAAPAPRPAPQDVPVHLPVPDLPPPGDLPVPGKRTRVDLPVPVPEDPSDIPKKIKTCENEAARLEAEARKLMEKARILRETADSLREHDPRVAMAAGALVTLHDNRP